MFQAKGNSNHKQKKHFNQIYQKNRSSFVPLIPVFIELLLYK